MQRSLKTLPVVDSAPQLCVRLFLSSSVSIAILLDTLQTLAKNERYIDREGEGHVNAVTMVKLKEERRPEREREKTKEKERTPFPDHWQTVYAKGQDRKK